MRVRGGVYIEIGMSPDGRPIEDFLLDPPVRIDPARYGISPVGVHMLAEPGVEPVLVDWIGSSHYPNVLDFIEEGRRMGFSRRISSRFDLRALPERVLFMHSRAIIEDPESYRGDRLISPWCPKAISDHEKPGAGMCAGLYWEDVREGGVEIEPGTARRVVRRVMPSFSYLARRPPDGANGIYHPGAFAQFPIRRLVVVRERDGSVDPQTYENLIRSGRQFAIVED